MRVLYHLPLSPFSRKVRLALGEKKLAFELRVERVWERRVDYLDLNPAGTVPTLEDNGMVIPVSSVITEYLEEAYPDTPLLGGKLAQRVEVRRLVAWFDEKFAAEVTDRLTGQKYLKRLANRGAPDAATLRAGYSSLRDHMFYLNWMVEAQHYLAGNQLTMADLAAAAHFSVLDYTGDVDWTICPELQEWYTRIKCRPSFQPLLQDRVEGINPPPHYTKLDF